MAPSSATALAHPNIALIKYWGKRDIPLNLPAVPSLSLTLDTFRTRTRVDWGVAASTDQIEINGAEIQGPAAARVSNFLDLLDPDRPRCRVVSDNNFPTAAGLASSSSGFAALAVAAAAAAGVARTPQELSVLARRGSGSACRSIWGGWVQWRAGRRPDGLDSHGEPVAPAEHWDVRMVVAVVRSAPKPVGSTAGMIRTQETCPLFPGWVTSADADLEQALASLADRDIAGLGAAMERSTRKMHATMWATDPGIRYFIPETIQAIQIVEDLRARGVSAWYTMDAGPNVKVLTTAEEAEAVAAALRPVTRQVVTLGPGGDAHLI